MGLGCGWGRREKKREEGEEVNFLNWEGDHTGTRDERGGKEAMVGKRYYL